jgi:hypothetical protein
LLIITTFDGYLAAPRISAPPGTAPPGTAGTGGPTGTGGTTGTGGDPLEMCYGQLNELHGFHTYCNETVQKDTLNVDHCYESLHMCNQWLDECKRQFPTMPPHGGNTPHHHAVNRALGDISEYDFQLEECHHELSVLWMNSRMCYHQVAIERSEFYPCHQQVMACMDSYEGCLDELSATHPPTNSPPPTHPPAPTDAPTHPPEPTTPEKVPTTPEPCVDESRDVCKKANKKRCKNATFKQRCPKSCRVCQV